MFAIFLTLLQILSVCVKCTDFIGHLQQIYTHLLHRAHLVNGFCAHDNCILVNQHLCRSVPTNEILFWWRHFFQNCFSSQFVWLAVISPNLLINMHELLSAKVFILPWSLNLSIKTHYFESIWNEGSMKTTDNPDITPDFNWFSKKNIWNVVNYESFRISVKLIISKCQVWSIDHQCSKAAMKII